MILPFTLPWMEGPLIMIGHFQIQKNYEVLQSPQAKSCRVLHPPCSSDMEALDVKSKLRGEVPLRRFLCFMGIKTGSNSKRSIGDLFVAAWSTATSATNWSTQVIFTFNTWVQRPQAELHRVLPLQGKSFEAMYFSSGEPLRTELAICRDWGRCQEGRGSNVSSAALSHMQEYITQLWCP